MNILQINDFSLEQHSGPYETWPATSKLLKNGDETAQSIPGYYIERQFLLDDGNYFFITSYDCPFEEQCDLILLNDTLRIIARHCLMPWFYSSWNLENHVYLGNNTFILTFYKDYRMKVSLYPERLLSRRKISLKRIS